MRLKFMVWLLLSISGCKETKSYPESSSIEVEADEADDQSEDTGDAIADEEPPENCVIDGQVCASYTLDWSFDEATEHCAEFGGTAGVCSEGAVGLCQIDGGLTFHLYGMPEWEANGYCDWLNGRWSAGDRRTD